MWFISIKLILFLGFIACYEAAVAPKSRQKSPQSVQSRQSSGCSRNEFKCHDHQCIPSSSVCDGLNDCQNGEDEDDKHCTVIETGVCSGRKQTKNFCEDIPNKAVTEKQNITQQFFCQAGVLKKDKSLSLACTNHIWTPTTSSCTRVCEPLTLSTSNVTCQRNGQRVACDKPMLVGTKIYPQCEFYYRSNVKEITCQENGEWSEKSVHCTPECGRQFKEKMRYTREMRSAEFREFPWTVSIYYTKPGTTLPILIPGTIISPYLVVTTAINFYADYQRGTLTTESVNVIVAKRTKEVESMDDQFQKSYKVQAIYFTEKGFQKSERSLSSENIAIIELDEKLILSPSVYPACVNWEKNETLNAKDGDIGQIPHTLTLHEANAAAVTQHEILQTVALRFVSRDQCLNTDPMKAAPHLVRTDMFCGEPISAPAPCDGAFVFLETNTNRFYVQGLVDGITPSADAASLFTNNFVDLSAHIDWMNAVRKSREDPLINNEFRFEVQAADSSTICAKNDAQNELEVDTRFAKDEKDAGQTKQSQECLLPTKSSLNANNYSVSCPVNTENNSCRRIKENANVPELTSLKIGCKAGFSIENNEESICFKGRWNPELVSCSQHCDKLPKMENGNFTCYQKDKPVKCADDLSVGAKLIPQCNAAYKMDVRGAESFEFVCQDDGKWLGTLPKCIKKSAKEEAQSKSNRPQTRNQNGSPTRTAANDVQPSLNTRRPIYTPNPNQTSPGAQISVPTRSRQQNTIPNNQMAQTRPRYEPRNKQASEKSQTDVQARNDFGPQGGQTEDESSSPDQKSENRVDDANNADDSNEVGGCLKDEFSCNRVCIPSSAVCNGIEECEDGSDESPESCKILNTDSCEPMSDPPKYCDNRTTQNPNSKNTLAKEKHAFLCNTKYMMNDKDGIPLNCVNGVSTPSTIPCTRICHNVTVFASGLDCYRNGATVDCKKPLLAETKIVPRCESEYKPNFNETTCDEKGEWDHPVIECIPECGKPAKKETKMTKVIRPAQFREFPWNVAVYRKSKDTNSSVLFAGIIISPSLILTNSHCCAKEMANGDADMDMFDVVVAKRSSMSDIEDDEFQRTIKVKSIHLLESTEPESESFAIVELAEKITSSPAVQPACVNWDKNETLTAKDNTQGLIAHWRTRDRTNKDTVNEMLRAVAMTIHPREICQKRVPKDFLKFLKKDAFCADPIPVNTPAHRGAGFIYQDKVTKSNYVQGVTYFTGTLEGQINQPASFTNMFLNISAHIDWINSIRHKSEKRLHREWILNTRLVGSSDVCKTQDSTDIDSDGNGDSLSARSSFSTDNAPDDFSANGCELPEKTWLYLDYNVTCLPSRREKECKKADAGGVVPEFASLTLSCNEGYVTNGSNEVVCFRKSWSPSIQPCKKICDKLELENVTLKCFSEDKKVDCESELIAGTTAIVECAPYHKSEKNLPKLHCDEYGHWKGASEVECSYFNPWDEKEEYFKFSMQI